MGCCCRRSGLRLFPSIVFTVLSCTSLLYEAAADSTTEVEPPPITSVSADDSLVQPWNLTRPLRICTAAIEDFGARCNGAPTPFWEGDPVPEGEVPTAGWCVPNVDFCGYDIEVADLLGLEKGTDWEPVCLGELGFGPLIDDLAREDWNRLSNASDTLSSHHPPGDHLCDIGVSAITANSERWGRGIQFSRATLRSNLAIMVYAPLLERGKWAFFAPLALSAWAMLAATTMVVPMFVFFFEAVFSSQCDSSLYFPSVFRVLMGRRALCIYRDRDGKLNIAYGLKECLWHSISQTLSIDVFKVSSLPARIVTAAYAFLVLIITHTYTANLAAFLTVKQLDTKINSVEDLIGKTVASLPTYVDRLYASHRITAVDRDGWDHQQLTRKLLRGDYQAVISDSTQLVSISNKDEGCNLYILPDRILPFDIAFAFAKGFQYPALVEKVDEAIVTLQEAGALSELEEENSFPEPNCKQETEFVDTNQVNFVSLLGLWYILGAFLVVAAIVAIVEYCIMMKTRPKKTEEIKERARTLSNNMFSGPRQLARSMSVRRRMHAPSLAGINTSCSSGQLGAVCDIAQLHSLHEALTAEDYDPVEDAGPHSPESAIGVGVPSREGTGAEGVSLTAPGHAHSSEACSAGGDSHALRGRDAHTLSSSLRLLHRRQPRTLPRVDSGGSTASAAVQEADTRSPDAAAAEPDGGEASAGGKGLSRISNILHNLPSCNAREVSRSGRGLGVADDPSEGGSVSLRFANGSAHCGSGSLEGASFANYDLGSDTPTFVPAGTSRPAAPDGDERTLLASAAAGALSRNRTHCSSHYIDGDSRGTGPGPYNCSGTKSHRGYGRQMTLGAVSEAETNSRVASPNHAASSAASGASIASPVTEESSCSDDKDADGAAHPALGASPVATGPRHVFRVPAIAEIHRMASSDAEGLQNTGESATGSAAWGNDCEGSAMDASCAATALGRVMEAAKVMTEPVAADEALDQSPAAKARRYMDELVQLRGVVDVLGRHLDVMIASTESSICSSSHLSSKSGFSDESSVFLPNRPVNGIPVSATAPKAAAPAPAASSPRRGKAPPAPSEESVSMPNGSGTKMAPVFAASAGTIAASASDADGRGGGEGDRLHRLDDCNTGL